MISTHARRTHQRAVDRAILDEPPAPGQSPLPYVWHSYDSRFSCSLRRRLLLASFVALRPGTIRDWMDPAVRGSRLRRQASRIFQRLAIPVCGGAMVVGEN